MTEALAISLFILAANLSLALPTAQLAAWKASPFQSAYIRQAQFILSR
jgi:hypothetical protein